MIKIDNVSKYFCLNRFNGGLFSFILSFFRDGDDKFYALKNINLEFNEVDVVGVVGRNGSGKTTLLKVVAGILEPSSGCVNTTSRPVYLSSFANGLNKNLSMVDNIFIMGTLNGLSNSEINSRVSKIIEFSGLEDFKEVPLFKFSSGMFSRFAFSSMIFTLPESPDILLLDEVLSVGTDDFFRQKIEDKIKEYIKSAKIVFIVNHNSNYILEKCSKIIWMESGEIKKIGGREVVKDYLESLK